MHHSSHVDKQRNINANVQNPFTGNIYIKLLLRFILWIFHLTLLMLIGLLSRSHNGWPQMQKGVEPKENGGIPWQRRFDFVDLLNSCDSWMNLKNRQGGGSKLV